MLAYEVWGLTGGIASGKSQAARYFEAAGFPVLDADRISRDLSQPGGLAHAAILKRFGTADRAKLREIVFVDPAARRDLEAILHPLIVSESVRQMDTLAKNAAALSEQRSPHPLSKPIIIYEAALLVETGRYRQFQGLLVVDAPLALRRERLIARDGMAPELADRILAAQTTDTNRLAAATYILPNAGTLAELRESVQTWVQSKVTQPKSGSPGADVT